MKSYILVGFFSYRFYFSLMGLNVFLHHVGTKLVQEFDEMFVRRNDVLDFHHGLFVDFHDEENVLSELDHISKLIE